MKVFITGATGYIGFTVAKLFSQNGHKVTGLVRSEQGKGLLYSHEIQPVMGEMLHVSTYSDAVKKADVLIHCAGVPNDDEVVETFLNSGKHFIYTSGVWLIGNTDGVKVDESSVVKPLNLAKWRYEQEKRVLKFENASVIRPACVYGGKGGLIDFFFESGKKGEIEVYGDGLNHWSLIHKDDLAYLYLRIAEDKLKKLLVNATDNTHYTLKDISEHLSKFLKVPIKYISKDDSVKLLGALSEGLLVDQWISNEKAKKSLKWAPAHDLLDTIETYFRAWEYSKV